MGIDSMAVFIGIVRPLLLVVLLKGFRDDRQVSIQIDHTQAWIQASKTVGERLFGGQPDPEKNAAAGDFLHFRRSWHKGFGFLSGGNQNHDVASVAADGTNQPGDRLNRDQYRKSVVGRGHFPAASEGFPKEGKGQSEKKNPTDSPFCCLSYHHFFHGKFSHYKRSRPPDRKGRRRGIPTPVYAVVCRGAVVHPRLFIFSDWQGCRRPFTAEYSAIGRGILDIENINESLSGDSALFGNCSASFGAFLRFGRQIFDLNDVPAFVEPFVLWRLMKPSLSALANSSEM